MFSLTADSGCPVFAIALFVNIVFVGLTVSSVRAEVSMTFDGYELRYASGSFKMSETYGQQFIDIQDVIISSEQGEEFTADHVVLNATGTMQSLDWIEKADIINALLSAHHRQMITMNCEVNALKQKIFIWNNPIR